MTSSERTPDPAGRGLPVLLWAALAGLAVFAFLFRLEAAPLQNRDEGIHAAVSLEMVRSGDWTSPTFVGQPYFRKPPLKLWLTALLLEPLGPRRLAVRLPSAVAGVLTALLLALWTLQACGSHATAFLAGAVFATGRPIFHHAFRTGEMDGLLVLFVTAASWAWWRARARGGGPVWMGVAGVALGLGFMTKAFAALLPVPVMLLACAGLRSGARAGARGWVGLCLGFLVVAAPWHVAVTALHGTGFWDRYFATEVVARVGTSLWGSRGDWYYFAQLPFAFFPWVVWLVPALLFGLRDVLRPGPAPRGRSLLLVLLSWLVLGLLVLTVMRTRSRSYLVLLWPPAVVLVVRYLVGSRPAGGDWLASVGHALALWTAVAFAPYLLFGEAQVAARSGLVGALLHPFALGAAATAAAWLAVRTRPVARHLRTGVLAASLLAAAVVFAWELRRDLPESPLVAAARTLEARGGRLVCWRTPFHDQPAGWFHLLALRNLDRQITWAASPRLPSRGTQPLHVLTSNRAAPPDWAPHLTRVGTHGRYVLWRAP